MAELLVGIADERTHLWFGVDYLPSVPDIDLLLVREELGCFNIEVKAVSLEMIKDFGLDTCTIRDRANGHHPVRQAGVAQLGLRTYLGAVSPVRTPFLFATAAFPKIRREAMQDRFGGLPLRLQLEGMLFAEDFETQSAFLSRLRTICEAPPRGKAPRDPVPKTKQICALIEALDRGGLASPSRADRARGEILRKQVGGPGQRAKPAADASRYLEPASRAPVIFRGAPGTGKTVHLQEIAVAHARAGRSVLFTCFNKVLASTLRAIMASQRLGSEVEQRIVIAHVDELRHQLQDGDIETFRGLFGTVCVDEAQDMSEESMGFLQQLAADEAEWFLADGPGQELYGAASPFLMEARKQGIVQNLRRNFRNKSAGFLVAQGVFENAPDLSKVEPWVAQRPLPRPSAEVQPVLGLDLAITPGGELPAVVRVAVPPGSGWKEAKLAGYVAVFQQELEKLARQGRHGDLAILFARSDERKTPEPERARAALELLGVPYHDQLDPIRRGSAVPQGHVRLASIHSARGIEASRVVLLDLDRGLSSAEKHRINSRIMAYIALSRAQVGTTIVTFEGAENPYVQFIERLVTAYQAAQS